VVNLNLQLAGHVARVGREIHTEFWSGNLEEVGHLEYLLPDGKILLEWICSGCYEKSCTYSCGSE
jgi:hypothetical protein